MSASPRYKVGHDTLIFALGNGLGISIAVVSVTVSALAAQSIGWDGYLSTIPYGVQFLLTMMATIPAPRLMSRYGRKLVFQAATALGVVGAFLASLSITSHQPLLLVIGHGLIGVCLSSVNLFRFAAIDSASGAEKPRAMSIVVFGGTFASFVGPAIVRYSDDILATETFTAAYLGVAGLGMLIITLLFALKNNPLSPNQTAVKWGHFFTSFINVRSVGGTLTAAVSYGVMNLVMLSAAIGMVKTGFMQHHVTTTIQFHVLAMFLPALFMGRLIQSIGPEVVVICGVLVSIVGMLLSLMIPPSMTNFVATLILAGLSWNMLYVAGSYIATQASAPVAEYNTQSCNEVVIGVFAIIGAFVPGFVMTKVDWVELNAILIIPVLMMHVLGLFLIWRGDDKSA